jgi:murein DD-endopeptidase MepM/ murein hydrolase activator NlpD/muramidase (phage lysozyme)
MTQPLARVTLGGYVWTLGDGYLQDVTFTLAEGDAGNSCAFTLYDPGNKIADAFLAYIEEIQGLEPLSIPSNDLKSSGSGERVSLELSPERSAWLDTIAWAEGATYNTNFGGGRFESFADHPRNLVSGGGFSSDAAGRYQALSTTWDEEAAQNGLADFSPQNQDKFAIARLDYRGALADVDAGNVDGVLDKISYEWASIPASDGSFRYPGQGSKTPEIIREYYEGRLQAYEPGQVEKTEATDSVGKATSPKATQRRQETLAGSQITIELGVDGQYVVASSFIHTGIEMALFPSTLGFQGQAASWVLTQHQRHTAYQNLTFKQVAGAIASSYGLTLDMAEDGPTYEYFPQRGVSDYEVLLSECRRLGYRMTTTGPTLKIAPYQAEEATALVVGENLGMQFTLRHQASGGSSGGARSADPSQKTQTGQRKFVLDPDTGQLTQRIEEETTGTGNGAQLSTTGATLAPLAPLVTSPTEADDVRRKNADRVKGLVADWEAPLSAELLLLDPDKALQTVGVSGQGDRVWVVESVTHRISTSGSKSSGVIYSPMKNKYPQPESSASSGANSATGEPPPLNPNGFIRPTTGPVTSYYRTAERPNHKGIDIADAAGTPVYASADGVVSDVENSCPGLTASPSCGGGYGNLVFIDHADGYQTRYAHLQTTAVSIGDTVSQGTQIGAQGNSGHSLGVHLHFEIRRNGEPENPLNHISE